MKKIFILLIAVAACQSAVFAQNKLIIDINEIRNNTGDLKLQLFDENEKVLFQEACKITEQKCTFIFDDLAAGQYAIRFYHDENLNGKLDTNFVGKPTEGYGFSNGVTGKFGPPPFYKWLFLVDGEKKLNLKPVYN